jgi:spore coat protein JB
MFFDGNDIDIDFSFLGENNIFNNYDNYSFLSNKQPLKYFPVDEGFIKGNMTINEYKPYKNYQVKKLKAVNEKELLLNKVMAYNFAFNDLALYLDIHPEDNNVLELFKKYVSEYKRLKKEYASKYGPLTLDQAKYENYEWVKNPWPWDSFGGSMYV